MADLLRALLVAAAPEIVKALAGALERQRDRRTEERIARYAAIERKLEAKP